MQRRRFVTAGAAASAAALAQPALAEPQMARFDAQRWALDDSIAALGMDWDQSRSAVLLGAMGPEASGDLAALRARIRKLADFVPAFEAMGRRREAIATEALAAGNRVSARDSFYMAAQYYGHAQWTIYEKNDRNLQLNAKKRAMFDRYITLADHRVEYVTLKTKAGKAIPAVFHLPPGYAAGTKLPAVVAVQGMDGYKERSVALYGDRWLNRGIAVLATEAPGEWEAPLLDSFVSMQNTTDAAPVLYEYLANRPEVDPAKIGLAGSSFGTFFSVVMAAHEPRFRAVANQFTIYEPGGEHIFNQASPTFKRRFMFMSGYADEATFDRFAKTLTLEGAYQRVRVPFLTLAGEADELSPLENAEHMYRSMTAPRRLVVYADARHAIGGVPSATLGPSPSILAADWFAATMNGATTPSERWFVDATGRVAKTTY